MMTFSRLFLWTGLLACLYVLPLSAAQKTLSVGAKFSGTLIENLTPCTLHPGDEILTFQLAQVSLTALKVSPEGPRQRFSIRLEECELDPEKPGSIEVFLSGQADSGGMLQLDAGSTASGVVMGLESARGKPMPLNAASPGLTLALNTSDVVIEMQAYLKAVEGASLMPGEFTATLNYIINYL